MKYLLLGRRFGSLVVTGRGLHAASGVEEWKCLCDCGIEKVIPSGSLRAGKVRSCGSASCDQRGSVLKDITGEIHGRLTIIGFAGMAPNRVSVWHAKCECGNEIEVRKSNLHKDKKTGRPNTVSCGCHKRDIQKARLTTHGDSAYKTKEYNCWQNMHQRCSNPKNKRYISYGAKGVKVCPQWFSYEDFLNDVGRAPYEKACIDRIDPYGNYEPSNVRWTDAATSNTNKRSKRTGV